MKHWCFSAVLLVFAFGSGAPVFAHESGMVLEGEQVRSKILGRAVRYTVYLPPGYDGEKSRHYPVLYLLHGLPSRPHDSDTDWIQEGNADRIIDLAISDGSVPPLIVVMPHGGSTFYMNNAKGDVQYETMFLSELVPHIEKEFRVRTESRYRAIAGLSMGGFGALTLAMRNPGTFSACAALSPGLRTSQEIVQMPDDVYDRVYGPLIALQARGEDRLSDTWKEYSPLILAQTLDADLLGQTKWYIDIGDDDFLFRGSDQLHTTLRQRGVPHEYRVRDGAHTWAYWRDALPEALRFISTAMW